VRNGDRKGKRGKADRKTGREKERKKNLNDVGGKKIRMRPERIKYGEGVERRKRGT
jgi:hypothetical protein